MTGLYRTTKRKGFITGEGLSFRLNGVRIFHKPVSFCWHSLLCVTYDKTLTIFRNVDKKETSDFFSSYHKCVKGKMSTFVLLKKTLQFFHQCYHESRTGLIHNGEGKNNYCNFTLPCWWLRQSTLDDPEKSVREVVFLTHKNLPHSPYPFTTVSHVAKSTLSFLYKTTLDVVSYHWHQLLLHNT